MDLHLLTEDIKKKCFEVGFSKSGIAPAKYHKNDKEILDAWIDNNYNASMSWIEKNKDKRSNVLNYYSESKSVISVAINYFTGSVTENFEAPYISNYALGKDYHIIIKSKLKELLSKIRELDQSINGYYCVDTSPIMEKTWAQRAGLGWIGKHTNLITREYGSWVFLGELIIDKELVYDSSFDTDLCGSCTLCIDDCPTDAIVEPYVLDSNKCISYMTIEHRGQFSSDVINLNDWIFGCDICQEVCPWNIKFPQISDEKDFFDTKMIKEKNYENWNSITDEEFRFLFKDSAVKRTKYKGLKRNIETTISQKEIQ